MYVSILATLTLIRIYKQILVNSPVLNFIKIHAQFSYFYMQTERHEANRHITANFALNAPKGYQTHKRMYSHFTRNKFKTDTIFICLTLSIHQCILYRSIKIYSKHTNSVTAGRKYGSTSEIFNECSESQLQSQ